MGTLRQDPLCMFFSLFCTVAAHTDLCKVGRSGFKAIALDRQRSVYNLYVCTFPPMGEFPPLMHNSFREPLLPRNIILFWSLFLAFDIWNCSSQAIVNMFSVWEIFFNYSLKNYLLAWVLAIAAPLPLQIWLLCAHMWEQLEMTTGQIIMLVWWRNTYKIKFASQVLED